MTPNWPQKDRSFLRHGPAHGAYGEAPTYPNRVVELGTIGTDPLLAEVYRKYPEYHTWYNSSWYAQEPHKAELIPTSNGYIAPPLDGVWATAPYLHNGSVPTLEDLLNSPQRPAYWRRSFDSSDYDSAKLGWRYTVETAQKKRRRPGTPPCPATATAGTPSATGSVPKSGGRCWSI